MAFIFWFLIKIFVAEEGILVTPTHTQKYIYYTQHLKSDQPLLLTCNVQ